jgi:glutaredoxin
VTVSDTVTNHARARRRNATRVRQSLSIRRVVLYRAEGCHLCERACSQLHSLRDELGFALEEIDITGVPELEAAYREWLPVVEIDGERTFVYYVDERAFRRRLAR